MHISAYNLQYRTGMFCFSKYFHSFHFTSSIGWVLTCCQCPSYLVEYPPALSDSRHHAFFVYVGITYTGIIYLLRIHIHFIQIRMLYLYWKHHADVEWCLMYCSSDHSGATVISYSNSSQVSKYVCQASLGKKLTGINSEIKIFSVSAFLIAGCLKNQTSDQKLRIFYHPVTKCC